MNLFRNRLVGYIEHQYKGQFYIHSNLNFYAVVKCICIDYCIVESQIFSLGWLLINYQVRVYYCLHEKNQSSIRH